MENLIKQSRDFLVNTLRGNKVTYSKELFISLTISKFLLLKENIIKKDSKNNRLFFNARKNKRFIPIINLIGNYVKINGEYITNTTKVIIDNGENNKELKENIWIFNKIRDSVAHGNYKIDYEKNLIIIDNDSRKKFGDFLLKCSIPLSLFEYFVYCLSDNHLSFEEYLKEMNNKFDYQINETDVMYIKSLTDKFDLKPFDKEKIDIQKISEYIKMLEDILDDKVKNIKDDNFVLIGSENYDLTYLENTITSLKSLREKTKDGYNNVLKKSLNEFRKLFKMGDNNDLVLPALYNYLQKVFSFINIDRQKYDDLKFRNTFGYLKTSNLMYSYAYYNSRSAFDEKRDSIYRKVIKFVDELDACLENYEHHPNYRYGKNIENLIKHFFRDTIDDFADKNHYIITSIRNSIEHGNIHMTNGYIVLDDKHNQNEEDSIGFRMVSKPLDLSRMIYEIEVGKKDHKYHLNEFLEELRPIINSDTYYKLIEVLKKFYKIIYNTKLDTGILMSDLLNNYIVYEANEDDYLLNKRR